MSVPGPEAIQALTQPSHSREHIAKRAQEQLSFKDPFLLRGTPVSRVLQGRGRVLGGRPCTADYYQLSDRTGHIDTFVSHNWCTPRWQKYLTLVLHFNLWPALAAALVTATLTCALTAAGLLPMALVEREVLVQNRHPAQSFYQEMFSIGPGVGYSGEIISIGFWCQVAGMLAFLVTLFFWHVIGPLFGREGPTVFLDRTCVHQTIPDLKCEGIRSLAAFMQTSRSMVVLYSDIYLERLWTVYELSTFMSIFPKGRLVVRPVFATSVVLVGALLFMAQRLGCQAFYHLFAHETSENVDMLVRFCFKLPLALALAFAFQLWAKQQGKIMEQVESFDVHQAQCFSEEDRVMVEENIVLFAKHFGWAPCGDSRAQTLANFNARVRAEVPEMFARSLGWIGIPYIHVVCMYLPSLLYAFDEAAGALSVQPGDPGGALRSRWLLTFCQLVYTLGFGPLCLAACTVLTRRFAIAFSSLHRGRGTLVAVLAASSTTLLVEGFTIFFRRLSWEALASDSGLVALLLAGVATWLAALLAFGVIVLPPCTWLCSHAPAEQPDMKDTVSVESV